MPLSPVPISNSSLVDSLTETTRCADRDRQPDHTICGPNSIAVSPVILGELNTVKNDEFIAQPDQIEIAAPRYVVRLQNCDSFAHQTALKSSYLISPETVSFGE